MIITKCDYCGETLGRDEGLTLQVQARYYGYQTTTDHICQSCYEGKIVPLRMEQQEKEKG